MARFSEYSVEDLLHLRVVATSEREDLIYRSLAALDLGRTINNIGETHERTGFLHFPENESLAEVYFKIRENC